MTTHVLCKTLVPWPGIKVSIRGLSGAFVTYCNISCSPFGFEGWMFPALPIFLHCFAYHVYHFIIIASSLRKLIYASHCEKDQENALLNSAFNFFNKSELKRKTCMQCMSYYKVTLCLLSRSVTVLDWLPRDNQRD